jgi:Ca-activated chloride channel homolog
MFILMETLGTKIIISSGVLLLVLLAGSATSQSAPPKSTTPTSTAQATPSPDSAAAPEQKPSDPSSPAGDDTVTTIRATTNEVNVVFTVTDKHGRRITNLKQGDFQVLDDSKPPEEIRSFHAETNLPLQVGLLIDSNLSSNPPSSFSIRRFIPASIKRS